jgi:hypothetical protein
VSDILQGEQKKEGRRCKSMVVGNAEIFPVKHD